MAGEGLLRGPPPRKATPASSKERFALFIYLFIYLSILFGKLGKREAPHVGRGAFPAAVSQADVLQGEAHLLRLARTHRPDRALARGIGTGEQEGPGAARQMHPEVRETLGDRRASQGSQGRWAGGAPRGGLGDRPGHAPGTFQGHRPPRPWELAGEPGREASQQLFSPL